MTADPLAEHTARAQRRIEDVATTTVGLLNAAHLGKKIRVRDYLDKPHIGVLEGIEIYPMPHRTVLHLVDAWGDVFVHPDSPVEVVA